MEEMVNLDDVLIPDTVKAEVDIQDLLDQLNKDNIIDTLNDLIKISGSNLYTLAANISLFAEIRYLKIDIYVDLVLRLSKVIPELPKYILSRANGRLIRKLYNEKLYDFEQIYNRFRNNSLVMQYFSDIIIEKVGESHVPDLVKLTKSYNKGNLDCLMRTGYFNDTIQYFIRFDNLDELQKIFTENPKLVHATIAPSALEQSIHMQKPSLISFAALSGAIKCFKFLMLQGSELTPQTAACAVMAGSTELLKLCEQAYVDMNEAIVTAVKFHQHAMFNWMLPQCKLDQKLIKAAIQTNNIRAILFLRAKGFNPEITRIMFYDSLSKCVDLSLFQFKETIPPKDFLNVAAALGNFNAVQYLLKMGTEIDINSLKGAAISGDLAIVKLLEESGFDISAKCDGLTPLMVALQNGHQEVAEYLIEKGADINSEDNGGFKPIHHAAFGGLTDIVRKLRGTENSIPVLNCAAMSVSTNCIKLLANSNNINAVYKQPSLEEIINRNKISDKLSSDCLGVMVCSVSISRYNISDISEADVSDNVFLWEDGYSVVGSPLHCAARSGLRASVSYLLELGADPMVYPLFPPVSCTGDRETEKLLVDAGAKPKIMHSNKKPKKSRFDDAPMINFYDD